MCLPSFSFVKNVFLISILDNWRCQRELRRSLWLHRKLPQTPRNIWQDLLKSLDDRVTEIIVKVMVELLSILARAKKQIKQGRLSKRFLTTFIGYYSWIQCREIRKVVRGQRDRKYTASIGPSYPGRGPHDGGARLGGHSWSDEQHGSGNGWYLRPLVDFEHR